MPRYGVSESGIGCKDNENNDYLHVFRGFFFMTYKKMTVNLSYKTLQFFPMFAKLERID